MNGARGKGDKRMKQLLIKQLNKIFYEK